MKTYRAPGQFYLFAGPDTSARRILMYKGPSVRRLPSERFGGQTPTFTWGKVTEEHPFGGHRLWLIGPLWLWRLALLAVESAALVYFVALVVKWITATYTIVRVLP